MPKLLTTAAIQKLKPDGSKAREIRDGGAPGLHLTIQPSGSKSWVLRGRLKPDSRQAKVTLGPLDLTGADEGEPTLGAPLSLRAARVLANQLLRQRAQGIDITEAARKRVSGDSFLAAVKQFIAEHARPRNRTWKDTARILGLLYPNDNDEPEQKPGGLAQRWATKPITDIDGAAIHAVITESRRNGIPSEARGRHMAAALGKLFSWAGEHRLVEVNPCLGVFRPKSPAARSRVLREAEVKALWKACDEIGFPFGHVVKLLLITGQRRNEVAGMRWSELNAASDFSIWDLPPSRTKNKKPHVVFMPPLAREIIASVPRLVASDFVFTTTGTTPISGFSKFKTHLEDAMDNTIAHWQVHDLRRTAVTQMATLGVQPHVIEAIVNHISGHKGGVAGVYNHAVYAPERKAALELWADHLASVVGER